MEKNPEGFGIAEKLNKEIEGRNMKDNLIEELEMFRNIVRKRGKEKSIRK
jgi:hypothetical protein